MNEVLIKPDEDAIAEAKKHPNGWVYRIDARYECRDFIPPHAIEGSWKVDVYGNIVGEFIRNPNYKPFKAEENTGKTTKD